MKRMMSVLLTLCLLLTAFGIPMTAQAADPEVYDVNSEQDFYEAFAAEDGVVTIPQGAEVTIYDEDFHIEDAISVGADAALCIGSDCSAEIGGLVNNGAFTLSSGAVLTVRDVCVNNREFTVMPQGLLAPMRGFENNDVFTMDGYMLCGVLGAHDGEPQMLTYFAGENPTDPEKGTVLYSNHGSVILVNVYDEFPADLGAAADDLRAIYPCEKGEEGVGFAGADIYGWARELGDMIDFNEDDRFDGIYVEGDVYGQLIPVGEDLVINKKLCVGPCDLVLEHGKTLTILNPQENLMLRENARIVCEAQGAAGPDCLAGGTLTLGSDPLLSGDPDLAPFNPTEDIIWLSSSGDEFRRYPAAGNTVVIGDRSGADVHGSSELLEGINVVMEGRDAHIRLTDDFVCADIRVVGELDLNGRILTADHASFFNDSRLIENGGSLAAETFYELVIDADAYGRAEDPAVPAGTAVYLSEMGIDCAAAASDGSFGGWRFDSGWNIPEDELHQTELVMDDDSESEYYQQYYFVMPSYPVLLSAEWDKERVEMTKHDTTVAFDGIIGHSYGIAGFDTLNSSDEEIGEFGVNREFVDHIVDLAGEAAGGDVLNFIALWIYDGDREIDPAFEMRVKLPEGYDSYDTLWLKVVHVDGPDDLHVDPQFIPCRVDNGVLIAELERNESAFIVVGSQAQLIDRVELELRRPVEGSSTDTPHTEDGNDWERHRQSNRPHLDYLSGPGAYVQDSLWVLAEDVQTPYVGAFENDKTYTFTVMVLVEPGWYFDDDLEIGIRGAKYVSHDVHIAQESGKADILEITAEMEPEPILILGDADGNGRVSVTDATAIQRNLALLHNDVFIEEAADADGNGRVTVVDATTIQRWLAKLEGDSPIGQPIQTNPNN